MATESLVFPGPPSLTNGYDAQDYTLGVRFSLVAPQDCSGVVWERTPDVVSHTPTGGQWIATLWNWDTQEIIASVAFIPLAAIKQEIPFGASFPLVNGVNYAASVFTQDYVFLAKEAGDILTPSGNVAGDNGVLSTSSDPEVFPSSSPAAWYFIGPAMVTGTAPAEGTSDVGLELAVAATGGADAEGAADLGLGLAVAATGGADAEGVADAGLSLAVTASGAARAQGMVALSLGLAVAATGERASLGSAHVGLGLSPAAVGSSGPAQGVVTLSLNLAVSATGSNGEAGRPVTPFPFTPRPVSSYPWTPRPVKSFQEVES